MSEPRTNEKGFRVLNRIPCVECYMDKQLKPMAVCRLCVHHEKDRCKYQDEKFRIKIISPTEPMRFNRMAFSVGSEGIRDESRNYYFLTDIMQPTKNITDCPEYVELKERLLSGELWEERVTDTVIAQLQSCKIVLERADASDAVFFDNGVGYRESSIPAEILTGLTVMFYLYDMYSMGGLADVMIDGRFYKVKKTPIEGAVEDMVMATDGVRIYIGPRAA